MKVHYVKNNNERSKQFQLKTIIFEKNGQKFVTKRAITLDAIVHLKKMKENYEKLSDSIINPKIKLAKIVNETNDSLTFEFIKGESLEHQYNKAKKHGKADDILKKYHTILHEGFKTVSFDVNTMVTDKFKSILGDFDYSQLQGKPCFENISNIDLIFSNIIFNKDEIYLIDYEWVYDFNIPVEFSMFRELHMPNDLYWSMEKHLVFEMIADKNSFLQIQDTYKHKRITVAENIKKKDEHIKNMDLVIADKESIIFDKDRHIITLAKEHEKFIKKIIFDKDVHIANQDKSIQARNEHIHNLENLVESMRLKNRLKRLVKKVTPSPLWKILQKIKHIIKPPVTIQETIIDSRPINNYVYHEPSCTNEITQEIISFDKKPLISIIMPVYNVAPKWLELAINSIEAQWYDNWELCMVDDKSTDEKTLSYLKAIHNPKIAVKFLEKNLNISGASNAALALTEGEYIALMDNDDELTPDALYEVVKAINNGAEFIYSDEDKIEMDGSFSDPHFKPDFAPDLFLSQNYLSHLGVIKKDLISKVGGFTIGLEGSQDFDLYLKVLEYTDKIYHIQKVLYHWRKIPGSTATEYGEKSYAQEAGRKALENAIQRRGISAKVKNGLTPGTFKVNYTLETTPLVSIIIPFKDRPELLKVCVESIIQKSTYSHFEIIGISNNSTEKSTFDEMKRLEALDTRVSFHEYNVPFNYSKINNYAVEYYAKGEHILFLNNDIEVITPTWIEEMLMYSQQKQNGAVGAKLYFPNDTIQHAGLIIVPKTIHSVILVYQGYPKEHYGYISKLKSVNNFSAVTAACLMLKRSIFDEINGFDAQNLSVAYNDVDLCLRIQETGYHNVWTPYAKLYHHESISRGYEVSTKSVERREKEKFNLKQKHPEIFTKGDPFYNPNLTRFGVGSEISSAVSTSHISVEGLDFYEEILYYKKCSDTVLSTVSIFSHFDVDNEIKEDVLFYLNALSRISDIIFVSTAELLTNETLSSIEPFCKEIIVKKNTGYDFGAWKTGLDTLNNTLREYNKLILCNDSVYGPLFDLAPIMKKMEKYDIWAMTDNHEIEYHLQSYFMVYNKKAFSHDTFTHFWDHFKIYHDKQTLIEKNEIGFSQQMIQTNLSYGSYYSVKDKNYVNVLQYHWDTLIEEYQFPFIKKELLKRNPLGISIDNWAVVIQSVSNFNIDIIKNQLK